MASGIVSGNDVYELVLSGRARQQAVKNIFYYRLTAGATGSDALALANGFDLTIRPTISLGLSDQYLEQFITVRKLDSVTDFATQALSGTGSVTGDHLPLYVAVTVKLFRSDRSTGNGRKSFGPIGESQQADGELNVSGQLDFDNIANLLNDTIISSGRTFDPVIVGGKRTPAGVGIPEDQWKWNDIVSAQAQPLLGSQNTRKKRTDV